MDKKESPDRAFPHGSKKLKTRGIAGKLAIRHEQAAAGNFTGVGRAGGHCKRMFVDVGASPSTRRVILTGEKAALRTAAFP
jgi:hypothetical protein